MLGSKLGVNMSELDRIKIWLNLYCNSPTRNKVIAPFGHVPLAASHFERVLKIIVSSPCLMKSPFWAAVSAPFGPFICAYLVPQPDLLSHFQKLVNHG